MRTKIVYVLVSQESDYYYEMLLLSLYSLRLYHPKGDAEVEVVMDEDTHRRLVDMKAEMLNDVTPIVVPIPPEYTVMQRSRYLKTQLRQLVKGDFLFIDCDTLICERLPEIDSYDYDVAMVANENGDGKLTPFAIKFAKQAGFTPSNKQFFYNSGVIFTKDTDTALSFFSTWHRRWKESTKKGVSRDQPALRQADMEVGWIVKELDGIWNCQLRKHSGYSFLQKGKIFHYYTYEQSFFRLFLFRHIKQVGTLDSSISKLAANPRSIGYSVFSIKDERAIGFILSDMFEIYDSTPKLYAFLNSLACILRGPVRTLSRLVHSNARYG